MPRPVLIGNPQAGSGKGDECFREARRILSERVGPVVSRLSGNWREGREIAAQEARKGGKLIIACGGDGTVNSVVNGLAGSGAVLGIIPAGRGNDLARALGIPDDLQKACQLISRGRERAVDTVSLGDNVFCTIAGLGLTARVNQLANTQSGGGAGALAYLSPLVRAWRGFVFPRCRVEHDGGVYEGEVTALLVAKSPNFGGGLKIAPAAVLDDGWLHIYVIEKINKSRLLLDLPLIFWGGHINKPYVKYFPSKKAHVTAFPPQFFFADGEPRPEREAFFSVNHLSLRLIC